MGIGGLLYSLILKKAEPSLGGFMIVSALQALAVLVPYALGDRIAHLALILNDSLRGVGLTEMALGWAVVMGSLAFLPSLLSGIQFPLLVSCSDVATRAWAGSLAAPIFGTRLAPSRVRCSAVSSWCR
jgi:spermidine synthase